ncbi:hypothetical protein [Microbispora sp. GKU 823]|uniref:hypothetical protein n=1 Tax=Microbispora sp. GKU 823 TaxID=1652100 RepID=UPI002118EC57|nr:hypothetical protein [Microbispora sp. GKU 823]
MAAKVEGVQHGARADQPSGDRQRHRRPRFAGRAEKARSDQRAASRRRPRAAWQKASCP